MKVDGNLMSSSLRSLESNGEIAQNLKKIKAKVNPGSIFESVLCRVSNGETSGSTG